VPALTARLAPGAVGFDGTRVKAPAYSPWPHNGGNTLKGTHMERFGWIGRCACAAVVQVIAVAGGAMAQECGPGWLAGDGLPGMDGTVNSTVTWDPDGAGPQTARMVAAGNFGGDRRSVDLIARVV
jgi:hypothetical protein